MAEPLKFSTTNLVEEYSSNPSLKALIQAVSVYGIPIGSMLDSALTTFISNRQTEKLRLLFDNLNDGEIILNQTEIENNDFLHAYFSTVSYVLRTRENEKIVRFSKILKCLYSQRIDINKFEDYCAIFNELSEREFFILSKKMEFEKNNPITSEINEIAILNVYWENFKIEILTSLDISFEEFNALLLRTQRTGCYLKLVGYWEEDNENKGFTTELFVKICECIR